MASKIIMVASGKGGTGKSTVSVLTGAALAARSSRVLLIELDSGLRSVDIISGVCGQTVYDIEDIFKGRCEPDKAIVESPVYKGLSIVSAPYAGGSVNAAALSIITQKLKSAFDYIIIDTAAGIGAPFYAASAISDTAIIVITPDRVAMRDGRIVADELLSRTKAEVGLIINKAGRTELNLAGVADLDECIDTVGVQLLGVVSSSPIIATASTCGTKLPAACLEQKAFNSIAARLAGEYAPLAIC